MKSRKMSFSEFETMSESEMRGILAGSGTLVSTPGTNPNPFANSNFSNTSNYFYTDPYTGGSGSSTYSGLDLISALWNSTLSGSTSNSLVYGNICTCSLNIPISITPQNENTCVPTTLSFISSLFGNTTSISSIEDLLKTSGLQYTSENGLIASTADIITFINTNFYTDSKNTFAGDMICAGFAAFAQMRVTDPATNIDQYHAITFVTYDKANFILTYMDPATGHYGSMTVDQYNSGLIRAGSVIGINGYKPH